MDLMGYVSSFVGGGEVNIQRIFVRILIPWERRREGERDRKEREIGRREREEGNDSQ
jgi:hypothetical protein